jgi:hypothetical protein
LKVPRGLLQCEEPSAAVEMAEDTSKAGICTIHVVLAEM